MRPGKSRRRTAATIVALLTLWRASSGAAERPVPPAAETGAGVSRSEPAFSVPAPASPAPRGVLELLPPGIRASDVRAPSARLGAGFDAGVAVERMDAAALSSAPPSGDAAFETVESRRADWLEVEYTIVPDLEVRMRGVLDAAGVALGHLILMDPATGAVFAYVSTAPEVFPATRTYPAASLMKVVTAAAALRKAPETAHRDCRYVGNPYQVLTANLVPPRSGGWVDSFSHAMAISNNQCFARLAVHNVGAEALLDEMRRVGLLETPGARHASGRVDAIEDPLDLAQLGSGLAGSFITPLGAARLAALLAQGELVQPYWIAGVRDAEGALALPARPPPERVWPEHVTRELREVLEHVPTDGTAKRGFRDERGEPRLGPIRVAGKTGTLSGSNPEGRYRWFIGVAPADAPRLAIATVVVEAPGAAQSASAIAAAALREVFCDRGPCDADRVEPMREHARTRSAQLAQAVALREATHRARILRDARAMATASDSAALDAPPHPIGATGFEFPVRLRKRRVDGQIVLLLELSREGEVLNAQIESSDLPDFEEFVLARVKDWRFTPPTHRGRPVETRARLPIPIKIN